MNYEHKELAGGRWQKLSFFEQMANIGSEVERAVNWKNKKNQDYCQRAFLRALELLDLTIADQQSWPRLKELNRLREVLADYFVFENTYGSTDISWHNYFFAFNYAASLKRAS